GEGAAQVVARGEVVAHLGTGGAQPRERGSQVGTIPLALTEALDAAAKRVQRGAVLPQPPVRAAEVAEGDPLLARRAARQEGVERLLEEGERLPVVPQLQVDVPDVVEDAPVGALAVFAAQAQPGEQVVEGALE